MPVLVPASLVARRMESDFWRFFFVEVEFPSMLGGAPMLGALLSRDWDFFRLLLLLTVNGV